MAQRSALMTVMMKAAEKAAKGLTRDFGEIEHLQVSRKGPGDFVSTADLKAQAVIQEELSKARPDFGFIMEESDHTSATTAKAERWIVDPLDGTTNFLHGIGHWAISIAAERQGEVVAGIIYDPIKDEMFWAEKGLGAYKNNQRLRVSARIDLSECLIATGIPFKGVVEQYKGFTDQFHAVMPKVAGIRRYGAAALDLAYVAAGRYDGYWEGHVFSWDVAAGILMVKEAGGFIRSLEGAKESLPKEREGSIIATNAGIFQELTELLTKSNKS